MSSTATFESRVKANRPGGTKRLAPVTLMPLAAFAVHQLRYWLAFGRGAGLELQRTGHSYLHSVVPWLVVLLALGVGGFLIALGRAFAGHRSVTRYTVSFTVMWLASTGALLAIYAGQEFLEGLFATGHPGGLAGIFSSGGWWAIFAAACVGLVLAAIFHGARRVLREVADLRARRPRRPERAISRLRPPGDALLSRVAPLCAGWSGRGPPR